MTVRREWREDKTSTSPSSYFAGDRSSTVQPTDNMSSQIVSSTTENQPLHLNATRKILQESKDCIKKSIDEATMEISRYSQVAKDYRDQTCQDTKEIVDNSLETLNEIMISFQSALDPYLHTRCESTIFTTGWLLDGQLKHMEIHSAI
jgi:hypothetical protein